MHREINIRMTTTNRSYSALAHLFRSKWIQKNINIKESPYMSYVTPVHSYFNVTWATTIGDE